MTAERVRALLFDRDRTLGWDVPYNGDPDRVELNRRRSSGARADPVTRPEEVAAALDLLTAVPRVTHRGREGDRDHEDQRAPGR